MLNVETGEIVEKTLPHEGDTVREFYSTLAGLAVNAIWGVRWADPVAPLLLLPLIVREGLEAMRGKPCCG